MTEMQALADHSRWVRELARRLVGDPHLADDLAQDVCLTALVHPPSAQAGPRSGPSSGGETGSIKGWLATVLLNRLRERRRGDARREDRERGVARSEAQRSTADIVEHLSTHRALVDAVLELEEPYRTTLCLRYFEELSPTQIAQRLGIPLSTVKTRLSRGLAQLRERLVRASGGDERSWLPSLVALAGPASAHAAGPVTTSTLGAIIMSTSFKIAALVATLAGGGWIAWQQVSDAHEPVAASSTVQDAAELPQDIRLVEPEPSAASQRVAAAGSGPAASPAAAPVDSAHSAPEPAARGAIAGLVLDASAAAARQVELELRSGSEVLARCASDDAGRFRFEDVADGGQIVAASPDWTTVYSARGSLAAQNEPVVVIAPRLQLGGRVVDELGSPLEGARLEIELPEGFRARFSRIMDQSSRVTVSASSGADGSFLIDDSPSISGARLQVSLEGFAALDVAAPGESTRAATLVLQRTTDFEGVLRGVVLDELGSPVQDAYVAFGVEGTRTDEWGRFAFLLDDPDSSNRRMGTMTREDGRVVRDLRAVAQGKLPASLTLELDPDSGLPLPLFEGDGNDQGELVLTLGAQPLTLTGRVVDHEGRPLDDIPVWIQQGTLLSLGPTGTVVLEDMMTGYQGRGWRTVQSDDSGAFAIDGLDDRPYRVATHDPLTLLGSVSDPHHPSDGPLELVVDLNGLWKRVAGRVVDRKGRPLADVKVIPSSDAFTIGLGGRVVGTRHARADRFARTDDEGRFELDNIPKTLVYLRFQGPDVVTEEYGRHTPGGLGELAQDRLEELEITLSVRQHLQVLLSNSASADAVRVLDEAGTPLTVGIVEGNSTTHTDQARFNVDRTDVLTVKDTASTLVLLQDDVEVARLPLDLEHGQVNEVHW